MRISPDGTRLATITGLQGVSTSRLDGSDRHDITLPQQDINNQGVACSPDGKQLVISVLGQGPNWLFSSTYDGPLGYLNGIASAPAFSESKVDVFNPYSTTGFRASPGEAAA